MSQSATQIAKSPPNYDLNWPTNSAGYHVQYATNLAAPAWQALGVGITTNGALYHQTTNPAVLGKTAFFRLSNIAP